MISNAILVLISYPINLYGFYSVKEIILIALNTWTYKVICAFVLFPLALCLTKLIKEYEGIDYYDYGISYNPLSVFNEKSLGINKYDQ